MTDLHRLLAPPGPHPRTETLKRAAALAIVAYAVCAALLLALLPRLPPGWQAASDWIAVPAQLVATLLALVVAHGRRRAHAPALLWALLAAFSLTSLGATYLWTVWRPHAEEPTLTRYDVVYLVDYALLTLAYAVAFVRSGGSFRSLRTWLDALAILVALLGTFWATLLGPALADARVRALGVAFAGPYAVSLATLMTMAALLYLRLPRGFARPLPMLLIGAGLLDAAWEMSWVASWLTSADLDGTFYNYGDVLCFTLIGCACAFTPQDPGPSPAVADAEQSAYRFLPTLAVLLAIAIVTMSFANTRTLDAWIVLGLLLLVSVLLLSRQNAVRQELAALHRATAIRIADERLTELVRESADAILVLDAAGRVTYASPSATQVLAAPAAALVGQPFADAFGADHRPAVEAFVGALRAGTARPAPLELERPAPGSTRTLKVAGANHLDNANIRGLALTVADITTERMLERDVLNVANQERVRLASDIHDGLAQQLVGVKLLLQATIRRPGNGPLDAGELREIARGLDEAIAGARSLALGISPLYVMRGSLGDALQRIETRAPPPAVRVVVDARLKDLALDENAADHLYRIAREAVSNAVRHGNCRRVEVSLSAGEESLALRIEDDGRGRPEPTRAATGLGIRLMDYRARILGGTFAIGARAPTGTRVAVCVPLRSVLA